MSSTQTTFKGAIYEQIARLGKSFSSGPRLELLDLLCQGPRTVEVLAEQAGQSVANTSRHLQVLRGARLVIADKEGIHVRYRLADDEVFAFFQSLRRLAGNRLLEIDEITRDFLEARNQLEPVDRDRLVEQVRTGAVIVLDVRPPEEYAAGHIPGAVSVPLADLEQRLVELPRDREVVAYCRGPYCVMAIDAVEALRTRGFVATRMDEGVLEWTARGLPVEISAEGEVGA